MTTQTESERLVERLTAVERRDFYTVLMAKEREQAKLMAIPVASLLASYLAFLGQADDANAVQAIILRLQNGS